MRTWIRRRLSTQLWVTAVALGICVTATDAFAQSEIVIHASDVTAIHGTWAKVSDATAAEGIKLSTPDNAATLVDPPLAAPSNYFDASFNAAGNTSYRLWLRIKATGNSKWNDSLWVQFSDARSAGSPIYPMNSASGLNVNLASDAAATSLNGWGWQNTAYWLSQVTTVTFAAGGSHTIRVQIREDGVELDQIVLSSQTYLNAAPGP